MAKRVQVKLDTVVGEIILTGDVEAVRHVVENDLRGRMALMRDYYEGMDNEAELIELTDKALNDHNFFRGMSYADINKFLFEKLEWCSGPDPYPSHEITEL